MIRLDYTANKNEALNINLTVHCGITVTTWLHSWNSRLFSFHADLMDILKVLITIYKTVYSMSLGYFKDHFFLVTSILPIRTSRRGIFQVPSTESAISEQESLFCPLEQHPHWGKVGHKSTDLLEGPEDVALPSGLGSGVVWKLQNGHTVYKMDCILLTMFL